MIGCTRNRRNALAKIVSANRIMATGTAERRPRRAIARRSGHCRKASQQLRDGSCRARSDRRSRAEILDAVDRAHLDLLDVRALEHFERDLVAGAPPVPDALVELRLSRYRFATDAEDDVADAEAGAVGRSV